MILGWTGRAPAGSLVAVGAVGLIWSGMTGVCVHRNWTFARGSAITLVFQADPCLILRLFYSDNFWHDLLLTKFNVKPMSKGF